MVALRAVLLAALPLSASAFFVPSMAPRPRSSSLMAAPRAKGAAAMLNIFQQPKKAAQPKVKAEPLVIQPDYRVAAGFFLVGAGLALPPVGNPGAGVPLALIGAFLASRTQKVRFVFDDEAMEVMTVGADGELALSGENFAVGGRNRWNYDTFVNWEFYPSKDVPILVYFKETQTKPEGQIHFFPVLGEPAKLYESFAKNIPLPGK